MKLLAAIVVIYCVLSLGVCAGEQALDDIDVSPMLTWAHESTDIDAKGIMLKLVSGEFEMDEGELWDDIKTAALAEIKKSAKYMAYLCAPSIILAALRAMFPEGSAVYALELVCSMTVTAVLITLFGECLKTANDFISRAGAFNESTYPVMASILALSGRAAASALFTPTAALAGSVVSGGIAVYSPVFAVCAAVLGSAGQMSRDIKLDGLERLVKRVYSLCLGAAMTAVICLIAAKGELSRGYDSSNIQTAKFTIGSLLPIVGGEVADSVDALVLSASLVKNAVGVTGIILLGSYCLRPIMSLVICSLSARLCSALVEPLGVSAAQNLPDRFADAIDMLIAACAATAVLTVVVIGAAMTLFGG